MKCPEHDVELVPAGYSITDVVYGCPIEDCEHEHEVLRDGTNEHVVRDMRRSWRHHARINDIRSTHK